MFISLVSYPNSTIQTQPECNATNAAPFLATGASRVELPSGCRQAHLSDGETSKNYTAIPVFFNFNNLKVAQLGGARATVKKSDAQTAATAPTRRRRT